MKTGLITIFTLIIMLSISPASTQAITGTIPPGGGTITIGGGGSSGSFCPSDYPVACTISGDVMCAKSGTDCSNFIKCGGDYYNKTTACPQGYQFQCNNNTPTCVNITTCSSPTLSVEIPGSGIKINDEDPAITDSIYVSASGSCSVAANTQYFFRLRYYDDAAQRWYTQSETEWQTSNNTSFSLESGIREYFVEVFMPNGNSTTEAGSYFYKMEKTGSLNSNTLTATSADLSWSLRMNNYTNTSCNDPLSCLNFPFYLLVGTDSSISTNRQPTPGEQLVNGGYKDIDTTDQRITWYVNNYLKRDLSPDTIYYWRIRGDHPLINDSYFAGDSFKTLAASSPAVTTTNATQVSSSLALLNGTVNPNGLNTTAWFRYATVNPGTCNDSFGTKVSSPVAQNIGSGTTIKSFAADTQALTPDTTYFYCAIAQNSNGLGFGNIISFKTTGPSVVTLAFGNITDTSAVLYGQANPEGKEALGYFRYSDSGIDPGTCSNNFGIPTNNWVSLGTYNVPISYNQTITDLIPGTPYYFCAVSQKASGLNVVGELKYFITTGTQPANACLGEIKLTLTPDRVGASCQVAPSASGLSAGCSGRKISFKDESLKEISSCTAGSNGCSGNPFTAPSVNKRYTYHSYIDKNGDGDTQDRSEGDYFELVVGSELSSCSTPPSPGGGGPPPATSITTCGAEGLELLEGLLTTPGQPVSQSSADSSKFKCIIDPKAAFFPDDIPTFNDLKSLYYTQKK